MCVTKQADFWVTHASAQHLLTSMPSKETFQYFEGREMRIHIYYIPLESNSLMLLNYLTLQYLCNLCSKWRLGNTTSCQHKLKLLLSGIVGAFYVQISSSISFLHVGKIQV